MSPRCFLRVLWFPLPRSSYLGSGSHYHLSTYYYYYYCYYYYYYDYYYHLSTYYLVGSSYHILHPCNVRSVSTAALATAFAAAQTSRVAWIRRVLIVSNAQ